MLGTWKRTREYVCLSMSKWKERKRRRERDNKEKGENKRKYLSRLFGETWKRIGKKRKICAIY